MAESLARPKVGAIIERKGKHAKVICIIDTTLIVDNRVKQIVEMRVQELETNKMVTVTILDRMVDDDE
jgi:hypothetical protein